MDTSPTHRLAVVTGASSGIGRELARLAAKDGYDLVIAADDPRIEEVATDLRALGVEATAVQADLATIGGVEQLCAAVAAAGRPVDALFANAGQGLGRAFLDQDFARIRKVVDTNVTGTIYLIHEIGRGMREHGSGRILITGSIAGFLPGTYQAVYNGTKAFIDSFAAAIREELKDTGVTVTCLMPGPTETEFFERADLMDTRVGTEDKDDAADVARAGYEAMKKGDGGVIYGFKNKMQVAASRVLPSAATAKMHAKQAGPGTAK